jgi:hypothetical protein
MNMTIKRCPGLIRLIAALIFLAIAAGSLIPEVHADRLACATGQACLSEFHDAEGAIQKAQGTECETTACYILLAILVPRATSPMDQRTRFASIRSGHRYRQPVGACFRPPI